MAQQKRSAGRHGKGFWKEEVDRNNFGLKMMSKMGWEQGKGLGKRENGTTEFIRSRQKKDNSGIGSVVKGQNDTFNAAQGLFNDLLARLNASVDNPDAPIPEERQYKNTQQAVHGWAARRELYGKFKRAKDASNYDAESMAEIFGRRKEADKPEEESSDDDNSTKPESEIVTTTSTLSIRDYFATRMAAAKASGSKAQKRRERAGFSEEWQESYFHQQTDTSAHYTARKGTGLGFGGADDSEQAQAQAEFASRLSSRQGEKTDGVEKCQTESTGGGEVQAKQLRKEAKKAKKAAKKAAVAASVEAAEKAAKKAKKAAKKARKRAHKEPEEDASTAKRRRKAAKKAKKEQAKQLVTATNPDSEQPVAAVADKKKEKKQKKEKKKKKKKPNT